jgi:hypothetical protein
LTYDEWKLASPYEDRPEPIDEGDLADEAYEREGDRDA